MIKKSLFATLLVAAMCVMSTPAQAQFKNLGKSLGKAAKDAGKSAQNMATEAATEMGANKASDKIIEFMDQNNTVLGDDSEYTTRLVAILGDNFKSVDGKELNVKVYENAEANILTLNNGSIRIYSGMMDLLTDDEIKALIALQAAQIKQGNVRENLLKVASGDNAEAAGGAQVEKMLSLSGDKLGSVINELIQYPYTAEQNKKADTYAKTYLEEQGGNADAFSSLLSKFTELQSVDLEDEAADQESEQFIQATAASKFISANLNR